VKATPGVPSVSIFPLVLAWLGLVALTILGLGLGRSSGGASWLPLAVAAIVWLKAWIVARHFIESHLAHPFIAWVVRVFIVCVPSALVFTAWFGPHLAQWTKL
jgi:hypothetical protein